MPVRKAMFVAIVALAIAACDEARDDTPYLEFVGGGFIFNYNVAEAYYGFVARARREIPPGTVLEAEFENPDGGSPFLVRQTARAGQIDYTFRSPSLQGVKAEVDYRVELRLVNPASREVMARYARAFQSSADQDILPKQPLVIGPSYEANPNSEILAPQQGEASQ
ncbi:MAG: hypothetical protein QNJ94_13190 [Alphaproteobacteria bacterium]|nr:hypothetical protein [Alphaproteobacteria bacterium]